MSPEIPYESRYFSVALNSQTDSVFQVETGRIVTINTEKAIEYAYEALDNKKERGFIDDFRYIVYEEKERVNVVFLDCGRKLDSAKKFLFASVGISVIGYVAVLLLVIIFSNRIIRPISETYEKQ